MIIGKYARGSGGMIDESMCLKRNEQIQLNFTGDLPHWEQEGTLQFVTFGLSDSFPKDLLDELHSIGSLLANKIITNTLSIKRKLRNLQQKMDKADGKLTGECLLGTPESVRVMEEVLRYYDGDLYELYDYVIMPNHIHLIILPTCGISVSEIISKIKRYSARVINQLYGRKGRVWQRDYFDRLIRSVKDYSETSEYIRNNPFHKT